MGKCTPSLSALSHFVYQLSQLISTVTEIIAGHLTVSSSIQHCFLHRTGDKEKG